MVKILFLGFLAWSLPGPRLLAQDSWNLKKDKDNIRIYSRSVKDCKFNELRAVFDMNGTLHELHTILSRVGQYKEWVYSTISTRLIQNLNDSAIVYYSRVSAPWPLENRDFYSDTRIRIDSTGRQMHIVSRNIETYPVSDEKFVRIPFLRAEWTVSVPAPGKLHVEYTLAWNPGGNIPGWIANIFSTTGPFQSFSKLRAKMDHLPLSSPIAGK